MDDPPDEDLAADDRPHRPPARRISGADVVGAAMLGMEQAIYGRVSRPEIVVESDADGQDDGLRLDLDPDDPAASTLLLRPQPGGAAPDRGLDGDHPG